MKKGLIACLILGCAVALMASDATLHDVRVAGTAGGFITERVDTADTGSAGVACVVDTNYSDTVDVTDYEYVTAYAKLTSIDTGSELTNDTLMDTIVISLITTIDKGTANWTVKTDTFVNVGDSLRWHFKTDTMLYEQIFFKTVLWDSLDPTKVDTNDYYFDLEVLGR